MILLQKKHMLFWVCCVLYLCLYGVLFWINMVNSTEPSLWFTQWMGDRFFVWGLSPMILWGAAKINTYFHDVRCVRMKTRDNVVLKQAREQILFCFMVFVLMIPLMVIPNYFTAIPLMPVFSVWSVRVIRMFLGALLLLQIFLCCVNSNRKKLRELSFVCGWLCLVVEIFVFRYLRFIFPIFSKPLVFGWVFYNWNVALSLAALTTINLSLLLLLFTRCNKKDFL